MITQADVTVRSISISTMDPQLISSFCGLRIISHRRAMLVFSRMNVHLCVPECLCFSFFSHVPAFPPAPYGAATASKPITELTDLAVNLDSLSHQVCLPCMLMTPLLPQRVSCLPYHSSSLISAADVPTTKPSLILSVRSREN